MASSRRNLRRLRRWAATAAITVCGGVLAAGPASGQAATTGSAAIVADEGSAFGVSVTGGSALGARPVASTKSCPDDQVATLASAGAASFVSTGLLEVRVACTATAGSLRSRAAATDVVAGPAASPVLKAKVVAAECSTAGGKPKGATVIGGFEGSGKAIGDLKDVAPNTDLSKLVPGLTGVINEQVEGDGHLAVNALHLKMGAVDVVLGHVECGKGAADATRAVAAKSDDKGTSTTIAGKTGTTVADKASGGTSTTGSGPSTTKVKGGGNDGEKDKDKEGKKGTTTTVASVTTTTKASTTTTTKPAATPAKGGKGGLAKTGPVTGVLLVLAFGALGLGAVLRLGGEGLPALALARRARSAGPRPHRPATNWQPGRRRGDGATGLDAAARDALGRSEDRS